MWNKRPLRFFILFRLPWDLLRDGLETHMFDILVGIVQNARHTYTTVLPVTLQKGV